MGTFQGSMEGLAWSLKGLGFRFCQDFTGSYYLGCYVRVSDFEKLPFSGARGLGFRPDDVGLLRDSLYSGLCILLDERRRALSLMFLVGFARRPSHAFYSVY